MENANKNVKEVDNFVQRVKRLIVNKDKNTAAIYFSFVSNTIARLKRET